MSRLVEIKHGVTGWFKFEAVKADGTRRLLADWFPNLITNQGLDRMGSNLDYLTYCQVGSGDNTPANTDTTLETFVAATNNTSNDTAAAQASAPYYASRTKVFRFAAGAAAGNLSEVGIAWTNGAGSLYSRALILDGGGLPTTITVLSDEFLDVTYQLRIYPPTVDVTGTITLDGNNYNYVLRACNVTAVMPAFNTGWGGLGNAAGIRGINTGQGLCSGAIVAITGAPTGNVGWTSASNSAYGASTLYRDSTLIAIVS